MISLKSPIRKNMLASIFGIAVGLLNQILLVPFYILYLGNPLYSDWIVLSALTAFFYMSDIGLNTVIQNRFAIKLAKNQQHDCDRLLTTNVAIVSLLAAMAISATVIYLLCFDVRDALGLRVLDRLSSSIVLLGLVANVFIRMLGGIYNAIYRATHHANVSTFLDQITILMMVLVSLAALLLGGSLVSLSLLLCLPSLLMLIYKRRDSKRYYAYSFHWKRIDWSLLRRLIYPSLTFMSFPLGNAIVLQGYTLLVNRFFGADAVVLYNTTRTMCNFVKTLLGTVQTSVWPEYTIAYGRSDFYRMRLLHRRCIKTVLLGGLSIGLGVLLLGPMIYRVWTAGQVQFSYSLMCVYLLVILIESLWISSSVTLMATNKHSRVGIVYVLLSGVAFALAYYYGRDLALYQITATLLLIHIPLVFYSIREGLILTKDRLSWRIAPGSD